MKKTISILLVALFLFAGFQLSAQEKANRDALVPPAAFNYQAVLRDASGVILADEAVEVMIEIIESTVDGAVVYTQSESLSTNAQGLLNIVIGNGSDLDAINWSANKHFIRLTVNGTEMGTSELLTVPYAMYADMSRVSATAIDADNAVFATEATDAVNAMYADTAEFATEATDAVNATYADTAVFAENVQWGRNINTIYALTNKVAIGVENSAAAQLHIAREDAAVNSQIFVKQIGVGDAAIGLNTPSETYSIGIDQSDANKLKISSTYGPSQGQESITITSDDKVGIGTSNPDAQLHVEGGMKVGETGVEIGDIIELTGTTSPSLAFLNISWPAGFDKTNTRVLSAEIQQFGSAMAYKSVGFTIDGVDGSLYVSLSSAIWLYYPDDETMKSQNYRITLMRVQ
jgi:hypothetical protein